MEFDLGLAIEQSSSNPVYYVQYAHARIHSIFRKMKENGIEITTATAQQLNLLSAPEERELIRHLSSMEKVVVECAKNYDPSGITRYAMELATLFHKFYNSCHVSGVETDLMMARLALCDAVRIGLQRLVHDEDRHSRIYVKHPHFTRYKPSNCKRKGTVLSCTVPFKLSLIHFINQRPRTDRHLDPSWLKPAFNGISSRFYIAPGATIERNLTSV